MKLPNTVPLVSVISPERSSFPCTARAKLVLVVATLAVLVNRLVEEAVVLNIFVVVALVVVPFVTVKAEIVDDAEMIKPRVVVGVRYPFP